MVDIYLHDGGYAGSIRDGILQAASDITSVPDGQCWTVLISASTYSSRMVNSSFNSISTPKKITIIVLPVIQQVSTSLSLDRNGEQNECVWQYIQ